MFVNDRALEDWEQEWLSAVWDGTVADYRRLALGKVREAEKLDPLCLCKGAAELIDGDRQLAAAHRLERMTRTPEGCLVVYLYSLFAFLGGGKADEARETARLRARTSYLRRRALRGQHLRGL